MKTGEELHCKVCQSPRLPRVVLKANSQSGQQDQQEQDARTSCDHSSARRSSPYSSANPGRHWCAATHLVGPFGQQGLYCASRQLEHGSWTSTVGHATLFFSMQRHPPHFVGGTRREEFEPEHTQKVTEMQTYSRLCPSVSDEKSLQAWVGDLLKNCSGTRPEEGSQGKAEHVTRGCQLPMV